MENDPVPRSDSPAFQPLAICPDKRGCWEEGWCQRGCSRGLAGPTPIDTPDSVYAEYEEALAHGRRVAAAIIRESMERKDGRPDYVNINYVSGEVACWGPCCYMPENEVDESP